MLLKGSTKMMNQKEQSSCGNPLSANRQCLVVQNLKAEEEDTEFQIFCNVHDLRSHYHCRIPELLGRRIRGCCHGWVILSKHPHNVEWCLWNPVVSKLILLPRLVNKQGDSYVINGCCLSSPPDHSSSILLLTRAEKPNFVFCRLDRKRNRMKWIEMSYAKSLMGATGHDGFLGFLTHCNGKIYSIVAIELATCLIVCVDIVVKDKEVVISLLPFLESPFPPYFPAFHESSFLAGSSTELFLVCVNCAPSTETIHAVRLFRLNMTSMMWEETENLDDAVFFVDLFYGYPTFYCFTITCELADYIHIRGTSGKIIYSYCVKDKTISPFSLPCLVETSYVSMWEVPKFRFGDGEGESCNSKQDDEMLVKTVELNNTTDDSRLLGIPFHLLQMIMELCVGVEYLKFRATCRRSHLAAPLIQWRDESALPRLHNYSLASPWLMVFDRARGVITFTDPMFGDTYYTKTVPVLIHDEPMIYCSRDGWLLISSSFRHFVFFNPFTNDIRQLPYAPVQFEAACFTRPPTSPDCIVVGLATILDERAWILSIGRETPWRLIVLDVVVRHPFIPCYRFPTFHGEDLYVLCNDGKLDVLRECGQDLVRERVVHEAPRFCCTSNTQCFLVASDEHLLLVVMGEIGESIEVFQLNTQEWEKIGSLGRRTIFICDHTCLCVETKTREMENKVYFPRLHIEKGKILFYSLETCRYGQGDFEDLTGTRLDLHPHAWIEPSWSKPA